MKVRVYRRAGSWCLDYRWPDTRKGKRFRYAVGEKKKTADLAAEQIRADVAAGRFTGPQTTGRRGSESVAVVSTFGKLCDEFLKLKKNKCRLGTVEFYEVKLANLRAYFGEDASPASISSRQVEQFEAKRRGEFSPADANRHMTVLKGLFKKAVKWKLVAVNPAETIENVKEQGSERFLTRDEADAILEQSAPWLRAVVIAFLQTGARRGDLCGDNYGRPVLTWADVDLDRKQMTIRGTKEGTTRHVPINTTLHTVLSSLPSRFAGREVFLDDKGRTVRADRALRAFKDAAVSAGVADAAVLRLHDLRHTAASWMVQAGTPLYEVQKMLGHKTIAMTEKYAHFAVEHLTRAAESLSGTQWAQPGRLNESARGTSVPQGPGK